MTMNECQRRSSRCKKVEVLCDCGCGTVILRYRGKVGRLNFAGRDHQGRYETNKYLTDLCGPFLPLVTEYLTGAAGKRYSNTRFARSHICPFFLYLRENQVLLRDVAPATVSGFQSWARDHGYRAAANDISPLSTFFLWAIVEEHYSGSSPVIPKIHGRRSKPRAGKPYSPAEMRVIRALLEKRGNDRLLAFFELAVESGLRKQEIGRLTLEDLYLDLRQLRVRLPNKTSRERIAFFSNVASHRLLQWIRVRRQDCNHPYVFHNFLGGPLKWASITNEFNRTLCKRYRGGVIHEEGLESFSLHRLRHTLASNLANTGADATTLMVTLGWVCPASLEDYVKIDPNAKAVGFCNATNPLAHNGPDFWSKVLVTPQDVLQRHAD